MMAVRPWKERTVHQQEHTSGVLLIDSRIYTKAGFIPNFAGGEEYYCLLDHSPSLGDSLCPVRCCDLPTRLKWGDFHVILEISDLSGKPVSGRVYYSGGGEGYRDKHPPLPIHDPQGAQ